jgi:hypothetical protein
MADKLIFVVRYTDEKTDKAKNILPFILMSRISRRCSTS